jgi:hypothetical protein
MTVNHHVPCSSHGIGARINRKVSSSKRKGRAARFGPFSFRGANWVASFAPGVRVEIRTCKAAAFRRNPPRHRLGRRRGNHGTWWRRRRSKDFGRTVNVEPSTGPHANQLHAARLTERQLRAMQPFRRGWMDARWAPSPQNTQSKQHKTPPFVLSVFTTRTVSS